MKLALPLVLQSTALRLQLALKTEIPAVWAEGRKFEDADQAKAIGTVLVESLHQHLAKARIRYLFAQQMRKGSTLTLGKAKKASAVVTHLAKVDFLITLNWEAWKELKPEQRIALVDHELCHAGVDGKGKWTVIPHDVEEFGPIVGRWGFWTPDLEVFAQHVAAQLELLPKALPKPGARA